MLKDLILRNRSYRRFHQYEPVATDTLKGFVNLARLSPSAANLQELKYILSNDAEYNKMIFSCLAWAGYLKDWHGPSEGERPSAYIVILGDTTIGTKHAVNPGIAAQSILLGATEKGLGGCIFGSIDREALRSKLSIDPQFEILLVIALGRPLEEVVIEEVGTDNNIKYWRDDQQKHHVPKRKLVDIILKTYS